jgi:hypothetical protein
MKNIIWIHLGVTVIYIIIVILLIVRSSYIEKLNYYCILQITPIFISFMFFLIIKQSKIADVFHKQLNKFCFIINILAFIVYAANVFYKIADLITTSGD